MNIFIGTRQLGVTSRTPVELVVHQAVLYHGDACAALGEDAALELCDWACRQLTHLNAFGGCHANALGTCFRDICCHRRSFSPCLLRNAGCCMQKSVVKHIRPILPSSSRAAGRLSGHGRDGNPTTDAVCF